MHQIRIKSEENSLMNKNLTTIRPLAVNSIGTILKILLLVMQLLTRQSSIFLLALPVIASRLANVVQFATSLVKWNTIILQMIVLRKGILSGVLGLCIAVMTLSPSTLYAQGSKIKIIQVGCIDLQQVFDVVREDKLLQVSLQKGASKDLREARKVDKKVSELQTLLAAERAKNSSANKIRDLENEIAYLKKELNRLLAETSSKSIASNDPNATLPPAILKEIYRVVRQVSQNEGYSIILEKGVAVVYVEAALDITDLVIAELKQIK
ncbi:hypothetical protein COTS27_01313 [Spirochaetota bacterium]|nr:hypothetical protein COTS27_01313 [Spirochaetota bacterium]